MFLIGRSTVMKYFNTEPFVNQQYRVRRVETPPDNVKRTGLIAKKVGMTTVWDTWGTKYALTVLQVDFSLKEALH